jgi:hypothetical protein
LGFSLENQFDSSIRCMCVGREGDRQTKRGARCSAIINTHDRTKLIVARAPRVGHVLRVVAAHSSLYTSHNLLAQVCQKTMHSCRPLSNFYLPLRFQRTFHSGPIRAAKIVLPNNDARNSLAADKRRSGAQISAR